MLQFSRKNFFQIKNNIKSNDIKELIKSNFIKEKIKSNFELKEVSSLNNLRNHSIIFLDKDIKNYLL
ncbi:MAG: hypothetical protein CM15mP72_3380 [Pelagibacteraceae bacterium]|nr:MAG: hypothetical protein CM15mP72_3380 [Pelagibacteraceae bacterium]